MVLVDTFYCLDGDVSSRIKSYSGQTHVNVPFWSTVALHENRENVVRAHTDFVRAGANVIRTNTFEASAKLFLDKINTFRDHVHGPHLVMEDAVKVAEEAILKETFCPRKVLIAGSIGPYELSYDSGLRHGKKLEKEELKMWHLERMKRLVVGGVDVFDAEGIPSVEEALAIIEAVDTLSGAVCWISFRCTDKIHLASGERLDDAFKQLTRHPAFRFKVEAVGVDRCTPEDVSYLLTLLNTVNHWSACPDVLGYRKVPYIVCPSIGLGPGSQENDINYIVNHIEEWTSLGANIVGGCSGVSPHDIKRISDALLVAVFKAREIRDADARKTRSTEEDWSSVLDRLKKPSFVDQKKSEEAVQQAFRDIGDGGGLFSRIHSQMEQIIRENEEKLSNN